MFQWAKGFGVVGQFLGEDHVLNIPNCLYGLGFYCLMGLLYLFGGKIRFVFPQELTFLPFLEDFLDKLSRWAKQM